MNKNQVIECWLEVFPNSRAWASDSHFGGDFTGFGMYLAKDKSECANGIIDNDPLSYAACIENNTWSEDRLYMFVAPTNKYHAYSSVKLRKKTIKNVTPEKLIKRFQQVREFIMANKDDMINLQFDINDK